MPITQKIDAAGNMRTAVVVLLIIGRQLYENNGKQGKHGKIKVALKGTRKQKGLFMAPTCASKITMQRNPPKNIFLENE